VQVANGRRPSPLLRLHHGRDLIPIPAGLPAVSLTGDQWHDYRIECSGDTARVLRDGTELLWVRGMVLNTGRIGLHVEKGTVELRNIALRNATGVRLIEPSPTRPAGEPELPSPPPGVSRAGEGISVPRLIRDAKPVYTEAAMRLRLEGEVWLACIVGVDGKVEQCTVLRRLSTELDAEAMRAALQWQFEPGRRDGQPVRVLVTMSMTFALRE
jgi:TonB family protein